jgi:hypothetical protein
MRNGRTVLKYNKIPQEIDGKVSGIKQWIDMTNPSNGRYSNWLVGSKAELSIIWIELMVWIGFSCTEISKMQRWQTLNSINVFKWAGLGSYECVLFGTVNKQNDDIQIETRTESFTVHMIHRTSNTSITSSTMDLVDFTICDMTLLSCQLFGFGRSVVKSLTKCQVRNSVQVTNDSGNLPEAWQNIRL